MSFDAVKWAFDQTMEPAKKLVLLTLAQYADEDAECYPKISTIAARACISERSVHRHLADLEAEGLISREHRQKRSGGMSANLYRLHLDRPANLAERALPPVAEPLSKLESPLPKDPSSPQGDGSLLLSAEEESQPAPKTEDLMVAAWGEVLGDVLPKPRGMTPARRRALLARFKEDCKGNHHQWRVFLEMIRRSDFLCGRVKSDRPFKATLDWVLKPANFWKIIEGNYENRTSPRGPRFDTTG